MRARGVGNRHVALLAEVLALLLVLLQNLHLDLAGSSRGAGRSFLYALTMSCGSVRRALCVAPSTGSTAVAGVVGVVRPIGRPVDSVTQRLSTVAEHWEGPQEAVDSKDLLPVAFLTDVVNA